MSDERKSATPAESLGSGYFRLGDGQSSSGPQGSAYVLLAGDSAVLFDPGTVNEADALVRDLATIVPPERVEYVILHEQDPDLDSPIPLLEKAGMRFSVVATWRTWNAVRHSGTSSRAYIVDEHRMQLKLPDGRTLKFVDTPGLRLAGAMATWDRKASVLLSGSLFGNSASVPGPGVDAGLTGSLKAFHELNVNSQDLLAPALASLLAMEIGMVAPRQGSILRTGIKEAISALRDIEIGSGRGLRRIGVPSSPGGVPAGAPHLSVQAPVPAAGSPAQAGGIAGCEDVEASLQMTLSATQDALMRDSVTGLYNEGFFRSFLDEEVILRLHGEGYEDDCLAVFGVDEGMARIEYQYGPLEVEDILRGVARVISETRLPMQPVFRLHGASFALWMPGIPFHRAEEICESIRVKVDISKAFIEHVTVSAGLVAVVEARGASSDPSKSGRTLYELGLRRLRVAKRRGGNTVCAESETWKGEVSKGRILVADDDPVNSDVLKTFLENASYRVTEARDGAEALALIEKEGFDLVIAEIMLPKMDAFAVKELMSHRSATKDTPFILVSHMKTEASVVRASSLGIVHYLRKPYIMAELLGLADNLVQGGEGA